MPHGSIFILQKAFIELFGNFIYHNMNIFTGGAYAPCMGTPLAHRQREWDLRYADKVWTGLLESTSAPRDRARLLASGAPHSGDWMLDPPVRIAVALRLGTTLCEPHLCHHCREIVDAKGLHGLVCRSGNGINDVVWRSFGRAKIPAQKEPLGLSRNDGKRPDGVTIIPWKRGLCLTWDVTVPDTYMYAMSHLAHTSINAGKLSR